jgi:hypothetical protein
VLLRTCREDEETAAEDDAAADDDDDDDDDGDDGGKGEGSATDGKMIGDAAANTSA